MVTNHQRQFFGAIPGDFYEYYVTSEDAAQDAVPSHVGHNKEIGVDKEELKVEGFQFWGEPRRFPISNSIV